MNKLNVIFGLLFLANMAFAQDNTTPKTSSSTATRKSIFQLGLGISEFSFGSLGTTIPNIQLAYQKKVAEALNGEIMVGGYVHYKYSGLLGLTYHEITPALKASWLILKPKNTAFAFYPVAALGYQMSYVGAGDFSLFSGDGVVFGGGIGGLYQKGKAGLYVELMVGGKSEKFPTFSVGLCF